MNFILYFTSLIYLLGFICCGTTDLISDETAMFQENATTSAPKKFSFLSRKLQLTEKDNRIVRLLERYYFKLRGECDFDLKKFYANITDQLVEIPENSRQEYCPTTADYLFCFPTVPVNTTVKFSCPFKDGIIIKDKDLYASRTCDANGTWMSSNYDLCIHKIVNILNSIGCKNNNKIKFINNTANINYVQCTDEEPSSSSLYLYMTMLNLIGFSITIFSVSLAIFIFMSFRSLRCLRNMIHCNMLATFVLKCSTYIAFYIFVLSKNVIIWDYNHFMCVLFNIFWNYSLLASFFWNMIEAVYLITVIVAAYSSNKIKLWWYLIVGWVLPMVPIIPYSILTYKSTKTTCSWIKAEYNSVHEMLIDIPIYVVLLINFVLLLIILYVIIKKLRSHNDALKPKYVQYKKLTRATVVLFPLFGLTFAVFFWHPADTDTVFSKIYYGVNIFLQTTQGIWVSFVYCFLNDEVKNALKTKFRSWKISHISTQFFQLHRNQSQTYTTQTLTSNYNVATQRNRIEVNGADPTCLPMLPEQEDKL